MGLWIALWKKWNCKNSKFTSNCIYDIICNPHWINKWTYLNDESLQCGSILIAGLRVFIGNSWKFWKLCTQLLEYGIWINNIRIKKKVLWNKSMFGCHVVGIGYWIRCNCNKLLGLVIGDCFFIFGCLKSCCVVKD